MRLSDVHLIKTSYMLYVHHDLYSCVEASAFDACYLLSSMVSDYSCDMSMVATGL